uniref:[RNA-polymerase]-subunit kinase n=1 Tax=Arcella intermedia TaxID=1963864 RepID=A0A6B2LAK9_9EUKA
MGRGAFGIVYEGITVTKSKVAMKKVRSRVVGIEFSFIREIKLLQELKHEHVVYLVDIFIETKPEKSLWIVYEFMETDLQKIINDRLIQISTADCKTYLHMLLKGVAYLHSNWILHRDLCPGNLLISSEGILKIGDFGLAKKSAQEDQRLTPEVVTRWYRAPELLMGARYYGKAIDMWSVGCIFAELMLRVPYFGGSDELDQLKRIFAALGTPQNWKGMELLPGFIAFKPFEGTPFQRIFPSAGEDAIELIAGFLKIDPNLRISALDALQKKYFSNTPAMTPPAKLQRKSISIAQPLPPEQTVSSPKKA